VGALTFLDGGGTNGIGFRSIDGGRSFVPWILCPQPHIMGLAERNGVLYVAGKNYSDGWSLATSTDEGATLKALSSYEQVRGIAACAQQACASNCAFEVSAAVWTYDVCDGSLIDAGTFPPAPTATADERCGIGTQPPGAPSGCHCTSGGSAGGAGWLVVLLLAAFVMRRSPRQPGRRGRRSNPGSPSGIGSTAQRARCKLSVLCTRCRTRLGL